MEDTTKLKLWDAFWMGLAGLGIIAVVLRPGKYPFVDTLAICCFIGAIVLAASHLLGGIYYKHEVDKLKTEGEENAKN